MTTVSASAPTRAGREAHPADVLLIFGITGDLDSPPPVDSYAKGSWGPEAANDLVAGHGKWYGPWIPA